MTQQDSISLHTLPPLDWSRTALGLPAAWPACLRLSVDILLNCPLAMAIAWGPEKILLYNKAYAALMGVRAESVPGGAVPTMQPPVFGWNHAAMEAAWGGAALAYPGQKLPVWRDGAATELLLDLHYTPLRDEAGAVRGVLCAMQLAAAPAETLDSRQEQAPQSAPARILVVEDNGDARYLVCEMLRALGYEVDAAGDGERALAMLRESRYGILFSDVSLPGMSGVELARSALRSQPQLQVVFASGYGSSFTSQLDFPAVSMQKPYEIDQLRQVLASAAARLPTVRL
ncbi:histidine kinase [Massilia sp. Root418]|uniref:response regulator n=1 Tax=Massilia sp. Root418 TaxID=1736532 RepID=UPI0006F262C5|nr:response regulator [Massilia sp. Root418]KQX02016.1 histidine kinase [Massilia sp. Root418]